MPVQERERGCVAPDVGGGGGGRSMGRLGGGVSQVPPLPTASDDLIASKEALPIFEKRNAVMAAINSTQVCICYKMRKCQNFLMLAQNQKLSGGYNYWRHWQW